MYGPKPTGFWTRKAVPSAYRHLRPGRRYVVARAFIDFDGHEHPVGETWWFLDWNYSTYHSGLSLFVSLDGEQEWHVQMEDLDGGQKEVIDALAEHVVAADGGAPDSAV